MVNITAGQTLNIGIAIFDFCGGGGNFIYIDNIGLGVDSPATVTIDPYVGCLNISNIGIEIKLGVSSGNAECNSCAPHILFTSLGTVYTDSQGIASMSHVVNSTDLSYYQQAIASGGTLKIIACITNPQGQLVVNIGKCSETIVILQDLCADVTCPQNDCTGFDLYTYSCNPSTGACDRTLLAPLSPLCGYTPPEAETHYLYFSISRMYPAPLVWAAISLIFETSALALRGNADYYVEAVDFDQEAYTITITISKTMSIGTMGQRIQTMIAPLIVYGLAILAGAIAAALSVLIMNYMGSKSVTGDLPSTRVITVTPKMCTAYIGGIVTCVNPTPPMVITVEYCLGKVCTTVEITDGNPITFSAPTDVGITITGKVKDNPYWGVQKRSIDKDTAPGFATLEFVNYQDIKGNPEFVDNATGNPLAGTYIVYETTSSGEMVERAKGSLDAHGKIPNPPPVRVGTKTCYLVIPLDWPIHDPKNYCTTFTGGEETDFTVPVKTCDEAKNHVSIRTVYIGSDGSRYGFIADSLEIKTGENIVKTVVPTTDITYIDELLKDTAYIAHITKAEYTILNNDQQVTFTTDCGTTIPLIIESNPPAGTRDITIEVRNATTNAPIVGANVTLDTMPVRKTRDTGTVLLGAIPDGDHDLKIVLEAYKENISKITVSTTSTSFTKLLTVDQVGATVDTRIYEFTNVGDAIATKPIKFKGYLQYLEGTTYEALTDATVIITVKNANNEILKTFTVVTGAGLLDIGYFETGEWLVVNELEKTGITVEASFEGIGRYKPSSFSIDYTIATADACIIPLPWGGCLLSKETGTSILLLGALAVGGLVLIGSASKSITGEGTKIIERVAIPPHYTPPEIKKRTYQIDNNK